MGKLNSKLGYNLNVASTINAVSQTVDRKFFPATHTHLVMQAMLVHQINKKVSVSTGYAFGRHNIFGLRENERRVVLQGTYQQNVGKLIITHRGRYESRHPLNL
jgi:hypothetical protein